MMYRIYNQKEMRAMDTAFKLFQGGRINLDEYNQFIELVNNGNYMKLIGAIELMEKEFIFDGKVSKNEFNKGWENFLDKEDEERIESDFKSNLSDIMRDPFMDALIDGLEKISKQKQTSTVDLSKSRLDLPLCPRRNNGDFNYDYSEWLNNRKEVCIKCTTLCPERMNYIKDDEVVYNKINPILANESSANDYNDFDSLPIEDEYAIEPEDCLYTYSDVMRMLLNLSDIQIPRQTLMGMNDLELENYAHQISKNNDSFKFKYDKIREIMNDVAKKRSEEI